MDGTHVRIRCPSKDQSIAYYNKDGYHSFIIHAVCNDLGLVLEASVGYCGSAGDSTVWCLQPLYKKLVKTFNEGLIVDISFSLIKVNMIQTFSSSQQRSWSVTRPMLVASSSCHLSTS